MQLLLHFTDYYLFIIVLNLETPYFCLFKAVATHKHGDLRRHLAVEIHVGTLQC